MFGVNSHIKPAFMIFYHLIFPFFLLPKNLYIIFAYLYLKSMEDGKMDVKIEESGWIKALRLKHVDSYFKHLKWLERHERVLEELGVNVEELEKLRTSLFKEMEKINIKIRGKG